MPVAFEHVVIHQAQWFMPGEPVDNTAMDNFIAPLNRISGRIKQRILAENGIQQRYYADYANHWREFVKATKVRSYKNADDAASVRPTPRLSQWQKREMGADTEDMDALPTLRRPNGKPE